MNLASLVTVSLLLRWASSTTEFVCQTALNEYYRDCTCGVKYRDVERRCCSDQICLQPVLYTQNLTCPFQCLDNGTYVAEYNFCQCVEGRYGLCCEKETPTCGGLLLTSSGEIVSPPILNVTGSSTIQTRRCVWTISTSSNRNIALGLRSNFNFTIGARDCLTVRDGANSTSPVVGSYCGTNASSFQSVYSTYRHLYIELTSSETEASSVFRLRYVTFLAGQRCGPWTAFWRQSGTITSPQYPLPYRPNESCAWQIATPRNYDLLISVEKLDLNCAKDSLDVNGVEGTYSYRLASLCNLERNSALLVRGISTVVLSFSSGNFTDLQQRSGFVMHYQQIAVI